MPPEQIMAAATTHGRRFDGLRLLRLRWRVIAAAGLLGGMMAVGYYFLAPKWYEASILIVPKESSLGGLGAASAMLGKLPLDVGGAASSLMSSDGERISAILTSRSTSDAVIQKFHLLDRYDVEKIELARKELWSHCGTSVERKSNVVALSCEDKEPAMARDMAEYFGQSGDEGFRRIATSSASEERKFLEKRAGEARQELDAASQALRQFQEKNKIIDLPEQSKAVVSAMATLEGDLISKRIQLSYLSGFVSSKESSADQLERQIDVLRKELHGLEQQRAPAAAQDVRPAASAATARAGSALFPPAMAVPALGYQLEALYRELKVRETVYFLLTERFESLKVDEARDLSSFVVFDHAVLPTHRIRPGGRVVPIGMFAGLALGLLLVLLPAWWRDVAARLAPERIS